VTPKTVTEHGLLTAKQFVRKHFLVLNGFADSRPVFDLNTETTLWEAKGIYNLDK